MRTYDLSRVGETVNTTPSPLLSLTPDDLAGQALGLHATGMAAFQGIGALLAGTLAQLTSSATAITLMAAGSVTVTLALAALGRREERRPAVPGTRPDVLPEPAVTRSDVRKLRPLAR
ncbi:hypothetical protein [Streptomyces sp. CB01635]|uniref:hypothetical protein n=1 Tax=Streptomyces sp. CB01635 TaxID=2020326 RepID=UPI003FA3A8F6